ncbi:uncharacterized protein LOC128963146 [Oppia nitens]|uniref:uncharacterized protein LOC128963146 n=1 Tax=Oppia nitens TaxID=1686743 RepID=UPI0023DC602E|nr:uncharacterized protein LOC128963146 [Oppia nitens]
MSTKTMSTSSGSCICGSGDHMTAYCLISLKALDPDIDDYRYGYCPVSSVKVTDLKRQMVSGADSIALELYEVADNNFEQLVTTDIYQYSSIVDRQLQSFRFEMRPKSVAISVSLRALTSYSTSDVSYTILPKDMPTVGDLRRRLANCYGFVSQSVKLYLTEKPVSQALAGQRYVERELQDDMPISRAWIYGRFTTSLVQVLPKLAMSSDTVTDKLTDLSVAIKESLAIQTKLIVNALTAGDKYLTDIYDDSDNDSVCGAAVDDDDRPSIVPSMDDFIDDKNSDKTAVVTQLMVRSGDALKVADSALELNISDMNDLNTSLLNNVKAVLDRNNRLVDQFGKLEAIIDRKEDKIRALKAVIKQKQLKIIEMQKIVDKLCDK